MDPRHIGSGRRRAARRRFTRDVKAVQTVKTLHQDDGVGMVVLLTAAAALF